MYHGCPLDVGGQNVQQVLDVFHVILRANLAFERSGTAKGRNSAQRIMAQKQTQSQKQTHTQTQIYSE